MKADEYDRWYDTRRGQWIGQLEYSLVCDALEVRPGKSLLDVGCGTGWFTRKFTDELRLRVTGLDIDDAGLEVGRSKDPRSLYVQGDAQRLPFPDNAFDRVVSITALPFIADWPRAIAEIVRVTRDRFALGVLNRHSLLWREKGQGEGVGAYRGAHWHTAGEITSVLNQLPVSAIRTQSCVFLPSGRAVARAFEFMMPRSIPGGAFLAISGRKIVVSDGRHRVDPHADQVNATISGTFS